MPNVFGIPLIGFIQMVLGTGIIVFLLIKFLTRPKKNKKGEYLINDVHIIVGDGTEKEHQYVYIKDGKIMELSDQPIEKKNVQIIYGEDKTLMPSLIDSHIHIQGGFKCHSEEESDVFLNEEMPRIFSEGVLPYGITTIKDLDAPKHFIYKLRDKLRSGEITGPELLIVGPNFTTPDGHPANTLGTGSEWARTEMAITVTTPEEVSDGIRELKEAGVDFLKFTYQGGDFWYFDNKIQIQKLDKELMKQIIREGKENGLKSTAHVFYYDDVWELLEAGIYGIEHGILDRDIEPDDPIIELWKRSGAHFVPTINAMTYEKEPTRMAHSVHNLKVLFDAGIPIAMGTDNMFETMAGNVEHKELEYYVEAGLTPMQAIMLATKNGAEHLGIADRKGQVKVGMEADLILLDKNPAENISTFLRSTAYSAKARSFTPKRRFNPMTFPISRSPRISKQRSILIPTPTKAVSSMSSASRARASLHRRLCATAKLGCRRSLRSKRACRRSSGIIPVRPTTASLLPTEKTERSISRALSRARNRTRPIRSARACGSK